MYVFFAEWPHTEDLPSMQHLALGHIIWKWWTKGYRNMDEVVVALQDSAEAVSHVKDPRPNGSLVSIYGALGSIRKRLLELCGRLARNTWPFNSIRMWISGLYRKWHV